MPAFASNFLSGLVSATASTCFMTTAMWTMRLYPDREYDEPANMAKRKGRRAGVWEYDRFLSW
jgi:hypothetical protein